MDTGLDDRSATTPIEKSSVEASSSKTAARRTGAGCIELIISTAQHRPAVAIPGNRRLAAVLRLLMEPGSTGASASASHDARTAQDSAALADQVAALLPRLVAFAYSLTRDREEAADLAQETIARALGAAWRFTPGTNLKAWLFRILRNLHLNRVRQAARMPAAISVEELPLEVVTTSRALRPVEHEAAVKADLVAVLETLRGLPLAFALPLQLTAIEDLSYAETAEVLSVPVGTVMSRVHRGRRLLLARLAAGAR